MREVGGRVDHWIDYRLAGVGPSSNRVLCMPDNREVSIVGGRNDLAAAM